MIIPNTDNQPFKAESKCDLAHAQSRFPVVPLGRFPDLSPAIHLQRLKAYRVHDLPDRTVYEFWKIGGAARSMHDLLDRSNPRQCATITRFRNDTFILAYFPDDGNNQVSKTLPSSKLGAAIDDLIMAGF